MFIENMSSFVALNRDFIILGFTSHRFGMILLDENSYDTKLKFFIL